MWNRCLDEVFVQENPYCRLCRKPLPNAQSVSLQKVRRLTGIDFGNHVQSICPFCIQEAMEVRLANEVKFVGIQSSQFVEHGVSSVSVICALEYSGFVRTSIRHYKYDHMIELIHWFTSAMYKAAMTRNLFCQVDCIVHVPTSIDRIKKRGYDQSYLLAHSISKISGIPHIEGISRSEDTKSFTQSQTAKNALQRHTSLAGEFHSIAENKMKGQRILLIDDVMTTGATMEICSRLLLEASAASVIGLVIAYVP